MGEHPKGVRLRVANNQEVSNHKIDALCVPHRREVIGNSFEYVLEYLLFFLLELKGAIQVFFYLYKALVILHVWLELVVGLVLDEGTIIRQIFF